MDDKKQSRPPREADPVPAKTTPSIERRDDIHSDVTEGGEGGGAAWLSNEDRKAGQAKK